MINPQRYFSNAVSKESLVFLSYSISKEYNRQKFEHNNRTLESNIIPNSNIVSIPQISELEEKQAIATFIHKNNLLGFIGECNLHIQHFFPNASGIQKLHTDNEEGYQRLFLIICTNLSKKEAFKQSRKLFANWGLSTNSTFNKFTSISTQYVWVLIGGHT